MAISEREKVIDKLEEMLKFFRDAEIKNDNSLININEQLDDVISLLKYIPSEPSFDSLPREIKTDILNHLCDAGPDPGSRLWPVGAGGWVTVLRVASGKSLFANWWFGKVDDVAV